MSRILDLVLLGPPRTLLQTPSPASGKRARRRAARCERQDRARRARSGRARRGGARLRERGA